MHDAALRTRLEERGAESYRTRYSPAHLRQRFLALTGVAR